MARKICVEYIQARPVAQRCIALPGMNEIFELTVESCIEDIQVSLLKHLLECLDVLFHLLA